MEAGLTAARPGSLASDDPPELTWRRLAFRVVAAALPVLGLGLKGDLLSPAVAWALALVLSLGLGALMLLAVRSHLPDHPGTRVERVRLFLDQGGMYLLVPMMVPLAATGLGLVAAGWDFDLVGWVLAGFSVYVVGYLDYLRAAGRSKPGHAFLQESAAAIILAGIYLAALLSSTPTTGQLFWIGAGTAVVSCRAFLLARSPWPRTLVYAAAVGACVAAVGWLMLSFLSLNDGLKAAILILCWYPNQGLVEHTLRGDLDRNVVIEYLLFIGIAAFLLFKAFNPGAH
ncbi:MAG: DUF5656 family protein [Candidatus Dormibacteria bacterium]